MRYGSGGLDPWEYYFFRVFDERYSWAEKQRFVGWRREIELDRAANTRDARRLANDKLAFHAHMQSVGAPLPELYAVYGDAGELPETLTQFTTTNAVREYLETNAPYPLFVKPVRGAHGRDNFALASADSNAGQLLPPAGPPLDIETFIVSIDRHTRRGVLFQEFLRGHSDLGAVCGNRLTSVRIVVMLTANGPEALSAVWRIPTGDNIVDNFDVGRTGNLAGHIELETGRIGRVVQGIGWEINPVNRHPDTQHTFNNLTLPDWQPALDLSLELAPQFPGLRLQHWDIALTRRGPVVIELNVEGGLRTHQVVQQRGIYDEKLRAGLGV